jgi:sodium/hydrogen antiporter
VDFLGWMTLAGGVLLLMALASSYLRNLPVSTSGLYLILGLALSPLVFDVAEIDLVATAPLLERVTEVALVVSLFISGLKLRMRLGAAPWRAAFLLAGPVMIATIAAVAALVHLALGLPLSTALLVAAILAPTDPILASAVSVNDAADHDRLRYGLTGEAGLNDGTTFPFVVLALAWDQQGGAGTWLVGWAVERLLWGVLAGLVLGYALGRGIGRIAIALRTRSQDPMAPSDLLALALIAVAYVAADVVGAWSFLAVFAAGVGLRSAEVHVVGRSPHPEHPEPGGTTDAPAVEHGAVSHPPAELLVTAHTRPHELSEPAVAAGVLVAETLSFGNTIERLVEVTLILAVGVALASYWDPLAVPLALVLFVVVRPLAVRLALRWTATNPPQRWLMGWFGLRGIGSLYYLSYAIGHGASSDAAEQAAGLTISTVALSILLHGTSVQPLLARYERSWTRRSTVGDAARSGVADV